MKKKVFLVIAIMAIFACIFAISASAAVSAPVKPDIGVDFGEVTTIKGFTAPSQLFVNTDERVLLTDGNGNYVTYPTYYITKDSTTFAYDFSKLNGAQSVQYDQHSIVMLEIPDGITALSDSYFSKDKFKSILSIQIPGSVTTFGKSLFNVNKTVKIIEFLDGTTPVTFGDGWFGADWSGGVNNLQYIKFPNNLVSIGNSPFSKMYAQNKTVILGANLASFGSNMFNESFTGTSVAHVYASPEFFKTADMVQNLFGGISNHNSANVKAVLYFTGNKTQAEAFISKVQAADPTYQLFKEGNYKLLSAEEFNPATDVPTNKGGFTLVYGVSACDAFYNGHDLGNLNSCMQNATCSRGCGYEIKSTFTEHSIVKTLAYPNGFDNAGVYNCYCANADYCKTANPSEYAKNAEKDAIITFAGYSTPENADYKGVSAGFDINKDALAIYNELNEIDATLTIFLVNSKIGDVDISKIFDGDTLELADGVKGINVQIDATSYSHISISARGFDDSTAEGSFYTFNFIMAMAVKTEDGIHYIQSGLKDGSNATIEIEGVEFNVVTAEGVYNQGI